LKQEESQSASVGFTAKIPEQNLTADAYIVTIERVSYGSVFRPGGTPAAAPFN
jgi:iron complex outermembrane receptor protein